MSTSSSPVPAGPDANVPATAPRDRRSPTIAEVLDARRHRVDGWTPLRVAAFIEMLADTGSVTQAAAYVRMSTSSAYVLRNRPGGEAFAEAWESAIGSRHAMLTDIAFDRIRHGVERNRWWKGERVGTDRVFSDRLLIHQLDATSPDRRNRPRPAPPTPEEAGIAARLLDATEPACEPGCTGGCAVCSADGSAACLAAFAAEIAEEDALPPDVAAAVDARRAAQAVRVAEDEAVIASIGAALDASLGRTPVREEY